MTYQYHPGEMPVPPYYCPGYAPSPYIPPAPRGRWIWVEDQDGRCPACRGSGACNCVRVDYATQH